MARARHHVVILVADGAFSNALVKKYEARGCSAFVFYCSSLSLKSLKSEESANIVRVRVIIGMQHVAGPAWAHRLTLYDS